jgi:hypothetical protein
VYPYRLFVPFNINKPYNHVPNLPESIFLRSPHRRCSFAGVLSALFAAGTYPFLV